MRLIIEFEFPGVGFQYAQTLVSNLPIDPVYKPLSEFPDQIASEIAVAIEKYRKRFKNLPDGGL